MTHPYIAHTEEDIREMLQIIGDEDIDSLFKAIPEEIRSKAKASACALPAHSEQEIVAKLEGMSDRNYDGFKYSSFLGGGCYRHFIPSVVDQVVMRGEFLTSYTPYQPEVAQGHLQSMFEFQTLVCQLTGQDVSNTGVYDGPTALVEAVLLSIRVNKNRTRILVSEAIAPRVRKCLQTVLQWIEGMTLEVIPVDSETGETSVRALGEMLDDKVASVICGYPNYFGVVDDIVGLSDCISKNKALLISYTSEALSFGVVKSPGESGADISVGDMQSFGIAPCYGGPWCGFFAVKNALLRQLPGKIAGETVDAEGTQGFVLTLSTREQHIRRERATSNICTNNNLLALCANIYLSLLGPAGLKELAELNLARRCYLESLLQEHDLKREFSGAGFNEFVVSIGKEGDTVADIERYIDQLAVEQQILIGPALGKSYEKLPRAVLLSVTELNSQAEIEKLVDALAGL